MERHVDIVRNQVHAGYSEAIGRLYLVGEGEGEEIAVGLRENNIERWHDFLEQPIATARGPVYARKNPREYLEQLHLHLSNTYQFATELHSPEECPYSKAAWARMEPVPYSDVAAQGSG